MFYPTTCVRLRYGYHKDMLSGFSREFGYPRYQPPPEGGAVLSGSDLGVDLPAPIDSYTLQRTIP